MNFTGARGLRRLCTKYYMQQRQDLYKKVVAGKASGNRALRVKLTKMFYVPGVAHRNAIFGLKAAFTRARSSFPSSTCHRRRMLRRKLLRPRRSHRHRSKRVVGLTLVEEQTSMRKLIVLPGPRTRLRRPRRPYTHRAHLRRRGTKSVIVFAVPCVRWNKIELVGLAVLKTGMHANMLARARHGHPDGILLLLT